VENPHFAGKTPPKIMGLWDPSQACATKAQRRVNTAAAARLEPSETFLAATTRPGKQPHNYGKIHPF